MFNYISKHRDTVFKNFVSTLLIFSIFFIEGCFNFLKRSVTNPAEISITARSDMRDGICDMLSSFLLVKLCIYFIFVGLKIPK